LSQIAKIALPPKLLPVFAPARGDLRYRGAEGGRGSGKSFNFAKMAAVWGYAEPLRILCTRELQNSIKESFHAELKNAIASEPWLADAYEVGIDYIRGKNGTEFIFKGLRHNMSGIKSMAQIDLCIVEEAEDVGEALWLDLEPTIRAEKSEIWVIWNPKQKGSATDKRFKLTQPPRSKIVELNYQDNPRFPKVLEEQRQHQKKVLDDAVYRHIWDGAYLEATEAQIFRNKFRTADFTPQYDWDGPYNGLDFGFAADPTAGIRCWIADNKLFIEYDAGAVGLELDDTGPFINERIPDFGSFPVRADCARPESISYLSRHGIPGIVGCSKWKGSVEDGVAFIKAFDEIVIHPRCTATHNEFRLYSYKIDRLSGDVLPIIVDAYNHYIDALRYALEPVIQSHFHGYGDIL
jgi:phage terminase large subunit